MTNNDRENRYLNKKRSLIHLYGKQGFMKVEYELNNLDILIGRYNDRLSSLRSINQMDELIRKAMEMND